MVGEGVKSWGSASRDELRNGRIPARKAPRRLAGDSFRHPFSPPSPKDTNFSSRKTRGSITSPKLTFEAFDPPKILQTLPINPLVLKVERENA